MEDNNENLEGIIKFEKYENKIALPNNYDNLLDQILSLLKTPKEEKSCLKMSYKNITGDLINISSPEEYSFFLSKIVKKEISNIIYISIHKPLDNKNHIYDKNDEEDEDDGEGNGDEDENKNKDRDELFLRQGHIFTKNKKNQSDIFKGETNYINKFMDESIEVEKIDENNNNNDIISNNEIVKSVLPNMVTFPIYCNMCQKFPIIKIMYYCKSCKLNFCEDCEKTLGYGHRHCYYKIRNKDQYQEILNME